MRPRAGLDAVTKRKVHCPYRDLNPDRPARRLVTIVTKLSRFWQSFNKKTNLA